MKKSNKDILNKLIEHGYKIDKSKGEKLLLVYSDFLEVLVNEEYELLNEVLRLEEKKDNNEELTYLEAIFYNYVAKKYKKQL
ncbi:hypothetical protein H2O64_04510 [Kordia sp. YSTF-M3]|uniref:Uncharacterized protein n=1 Tax=Kordia aestuariivivens TaxID=2759037 RepID=A0ABR7Q5T4_9FLAO|nr:hypothetical protein [Kordia aestuariivivens]MBC8753920.1 hypothetical protein [Kordia aestuariivivens]